jgi:hypothetical protein
LQAVLTEQVTRSLAKVCVDIVIQAFAHKVSFYVTEFFQNEDEVFHETQSHKIDVFYDELVLDF